MATKTINTATVGVSDKWLYKAGGVAAYCAGLIYIASIVLYAYVGKMPTTGAAWLPFISAKSGTWSAIIALNVISDILFLLVNVALFAALRRINQWLALLGTLTACVYGNSDPVKDIPVLAEHVRAGRLDLDSLITDRITLEEIPAAFERVAAGKGGRSLVVF